MANLIWIMLGSVRVRVALRGSDVECEPRRVETMATGENRDRLARIAGRVVGVRRVTVDGTATFRTLMKLPSRDAYSSPATVEIRSGERFGKVGDEVALEAEVSGYPRSYSPKGGEEGDRVQTAEVVLTLRGLA